MERGHDHAFAKIELVSLLALRARVEREVLEIPVARLLLQVREQRTPYPGRATRLVGHQVVDIELPSVEGVLVDAVYRHAHDVLSLGRNAHARAARENALHLSVIVGRKRRAQLPVHRLGAVEPFRLHHRPGRVCDLHDPDHSRPSLRNISLIPRTACRVRASFSISAMRTWSSPYSPKPTPGETATRASLSTFFANSSDPSFA